MNIAAKLTRNKQRTVSLRFGSSQAWMHSRLIMTVLTTGLALMTMLLSTDPAWAGSKWTTVTSLPEKRDGLAAGGLTGALYAVGGESLGQGTTNLYWYDGTSWTEVAGMPGQKRHLAAGVLSNALYAVSGNTGGATVTNVYCFDGTTWTEVEGVPAAREYFAAGVLNDALYVIGGESGSVKSELIN